MTKTRTIILNSLLVIVLLLSGQSIAMARSSARAVDQMVLCTGSGLAVVYMDENGQPTSKPHACPDCVVSLFSALFSQTELAEFDGRFCHSKPKSIVASLNEPEISPYRSRAPPLL